MKKIILSLVVMLIVQTSITAQKKYSKLISKNAKAYVEKVTEEVVLSKEEKETLFELKCEYSLSYIRISTEFKGSTDLNVERKKNSEFYHESLTAFFGVEKKKNMLKAIRSKDNERYAFSH